MCVIGDGHITIDYERDHNGKHLKDIINDNTCYLDFGYEIICDYDWFIDELIDVLKTNTSLKRINLGVVGIYGCLQEILDAIESNKNLKLTELVMSTRILEREVILLSNFIKKNKTLVYFSYTDPTCVYMCDEIIKLYIDTLHINKYIDIDIGEYNYLVTYDLFKKFKNMVESNKNRYSILKNTQKLFPLLLFGIKDKNSTLKVLNRDVMYEIFINLK